MKTKADSRTETVKCRVTVEELLDIDEKAYQLQTSRSDYLRRLIFDKEVVIYDFSALDNLTAQIGKIGVNINQIAKKLNQGDNLDKGNAEYLVGAMETIHESIKKIYRDTIKKKSEGG
ncbi:plasmid mobilization protein [Sinanaerobacter sp. ZZT-01]|uniref:plasmid mobilization protein n=1 Tax=Sinanaerobacter sp. ZZT-01 TaxID=3111540 RepID=UPI002D79535B|nr:plasmid mobilization relaxosome protein MobC [Sinanaerobacter sp. ZZT-01]WRR94246.1 plasmid mobilization relaxosome protein MobC [Sinanaerobacter sp. ZZT-01]